MNFSFSHWSLQLRPHHLVCLPHYVGKMYTQQASLCLEELIGRINRGENRALIVSGQDDLCNGCGGNEGKACHGEQTEKMDLAAQDVLRVILPNTNWAVGSVCSFDEVAVLAILSASERGLFDRVCKPCRAASFCRNVVHNRFDERHLYPSARSPHAVTAIYQQGQSCAMLKPR